MGTTLERPAEAPPTATPGRRRAADPVSWVLLLLAACLAAAGSPLVVKGLTMLPEAHRRSQLDYADGIGWILPWMLLVSGGTAVAVACALGWWESRRHDNRVARVIRWTAGSALVLLAAGAAFTLFVAGLGDRCWGSCS